MHVENDLTDEEVLRLSLQSPSQYALLVERYQRPLGNFVTSRFVSDRDEAADIVQDSFLRGYQSIGKFDFTKKWKPWIYKITANTACNYLRRSRYNDALFEKLINEQDQFSVPQDVFFATDRADEIRSALELLSPNYHEILTKFYFENKKSSEISAELGLSSFLVKTRLERGRKELKGLLESFNLI